MDFTKAHVDPGGQLLVNPISTNETRANNLLLDLLEVEGLLAVNLRPKSLPNQVISWHRGELFANATLRVSKNLSAFDDSDLDHYPAVKLRNWRIDLGSTVDVSESLVRDGLVSWVND